MLNLVKSVILSANVIVELFLFLIKKVSFYDAKDAILTVVRCSHQLAYCFEEVMNIHALIHIQKESTSLRVRQTI
jgi:hypothetical protein